MRRPACFIKIVADALAPNKRQALAATALTPLWLWCHVNYIAQGPLNKLCSREVGNPPVSLLLVVRLFAAMTLQVLWVKARTNVYLCGCKDVHNNMQYWTVLYGESAMIYDGSQHDILGLAKAFSTWFLFHSQSINMNSWKKNIITKPEIYSYLTNRTIIVNTSNIMIMPLRCLAPKAKNMTKYDYTLYKHN